MYASELMEKVRKEPKKYEGKQYKIVGECIKRTGEPSNDKTVRIFDGRPMTDTCAAVFITFDTQLKEIRQSVTWQEAIAAWTNGKKVRCEYNGIPRTYSELIIRDQSGQMLNKLEILNGTWYIED
jgi:hypothetical protein